MLVAEFAVALLKAEASALRVLARVATLLLTVNTLFCVPAAVVVASGPSAALWVVLASAGARLVARRADVGARTVARVTAWKRATAGVLACSM